MSSNLEVVLLEPNLGQTLCICSNYLAGTWQLVEIQGSPIRLTGVLLIINICVEEEQTMGTTGCNRFVAQLLLHDSVPDAISFVVVGQTRIHCPEFELEISFLDALKKVCFYQVFICKESSNILNLFDENKKILMVFRQ